MSTISTLSCTCTPAGRCAKWRSTAATHSERARLASGVLPDSWRNWIYTKAWRSGAVPMAKLLVTTNRLLRSASSITSELAVTGYFSSVRAGAQVTGDTKLVGAASSGESLLKCGLRLSWRDCAECTFRNEFFAAAASFFSAAFAARGWQYPIDSHWHSAPRIAPNTDFR